MITLPIRPRRLRNLLLCIGVGAAIAATSVGVARADTVVDLYVDRYAPAICATLDDYPTDAGVEGIGTVMVRDDGLTTAQAAEALVTSVRSTCPRHIPVLEHYAGGTVKR